MNAVAIPQAVGDWSLRGVDADQVFASQQLSDTAMTAAVRVTTRFDPAFPGWQLYRRVVAGTNLFDRQLEDWATSTAWMLATAHKVRGREYVKASSRRHDWVAQAGLDALDHVVCGRYAAGLGERADAFGVSPKTYQRIRDPMAACMSIGLETFATELRGEYFRTRKRDYLDSNGIEPISGAMMGVRGTHFTGLDDPFSGIGNGCLIRTPAPNPDTL
jgi:hypothetical protein